MKLLQPSDLRSPPGYSWFQTPQRVAESLDGLQDENLDPALGLQKITDPRARQRSSALNWCETGDHWLSVSFDQEQNLPQSGNTCVFSQTRTSTVEDGHLWSTPPPDTFCKTTVESPTPGPVPAGDLKDFFCTSLSTHTPRDARLVDEDSGFSSINADPSQDSSSDHNGSFQELLHPVSEAKRHVRLQRQYRLSTLREGGSQSEEDLAAQRHEDLSRSSNSVFTDVTPGRVLWRNNGTSDGSATSRKHEATPPTKLRDVTPTATSSVNLSLTPALQLVHAMCQQNIRMFAGQSPSIQEQLRSTNLLAKTPVMISTTMSLVGLIGRKMGVGQMDILTELKRRNLWHVLAVLLGHLTSEAIYRCSQVCKDWNEIILQDKRAASRRRSHLSDSASSLELSGSVHLPNTETRRTLLKRSALRTVQARSGSSSCSSPQSEHGSSGRQRQKVERSASSRREKFLKIARTLFSDECLRPCPRCQHPARCHSVKREGVCSRDDCLFNFCTSCLCTFHGSRDCVSWSAGRTRSDTHYPGSAQSKRNVRRL